MNRGWSNTCAVSRLLFGSALIGLAAACDDGAGGDTEPVDAGPPCQGVAMACLEIAGDSCSEQRGCTAASGCYERVPRTPCEERDPDADECRFAPGCSVSVGVAPDGGVVFTCSGTLRPCEREEREPQCLNNACDFGDYCEGDPVPCPELSVEDCAQQRGCMLRE